MHLLLIRHGQSYVNLEDWEGGLVDTSLTKLGQKQAARLAQWLVKHAWLDVIYTSTMARTLETAAYLTDASGLAAKPDDRLREFGYCRADGRAVALDEMPITYAEFWGTSRPYTQISATGESWILFRARVGQVLDEIVRQYGEETPEFTVAAVCHGGVIGAAFDMIMNVGAERRTQIRSHHTGIMHWEYLPEFDREPWRLHAQGLVHHLTTREGAWLGSEPLLRGAARS